VTVYWRPGCGFCHILRRELDRAGVTRDEVNIWEDPAAAARVRSVARGNETVPTVFVDDRALVNPTLTEVLNALGRREADPDPVGAQAHGRRPGARGVLWSLAAAAAWVALATASPTTTYHLAAPIAALAWPAVLRSDGAHARWRDGALAALGGLIVALGTTLLLAARGLLDGLALSGGTATTEAVLLTMPAALIGLVLARPRRPAPAPAGSTSVVEGTGGGCTDADDAACEWTPAARTSPR